MQEQRRHNTEKYEAKSACKSMAVITYVILDAQPQGKYDISSDGHVPVLIRFCIFGVPLCSRQSGWCGLCSQCSPACSCSLPLALALSPTPSLIHPSPWWSPRSSRSAPVCSAIFSLTTSFASGSSPSPSISSPLPLTPPPHPHQDCCCPCCPCCQSS